MRVSEPVGDQSLAMTQQYLALTPSALDATIRLLENSPNSRAGDGLETPKARPSKSKQLKGMNFQRGWDLRWKPSTRVTANKKMAGCSGRFPQLAPHGCETVDGHKPRRSAPGLAGPRGCVRNLYACFRTGSDAVSSVRREYDQGSSRGQPDQIEFRR